MRVLAPVFRAAWNVCVRQKKNTRSLVPNAKPARSPSDVIDFLNNSGARPGIIRRTRAGDCGSGTGLSRRCSCATGRKSRSLRYCIICSCAARGPENTFLIYEDEIRVISGHSHGRGWKDATVTLEKHRSRISARRTSDGFPIFYSHPADNGAISSPVYLHSRSR